MGTYSPVTRDSDGKTIRLDKQEAEQVEIDARAKRVLPVDSSGNVIVGGDSSLTYIQALAVISGTSKVEYIGLAIPGTAKSVASWQIKKLTYSGNNVTDIQFADGDNNFDNVWNDRSGLSYS